MNDLTIDLLNACKMLLWEFPDLDQVLTDGDRPQRAKKVIDMARNAVTNYERAMYPSIKEKATMVEQVYPEHMTQKAPYPRDLYEIVEKASCKPGWRFELVDVDRDDKTCHGLTLIIYVLGPNSDNLDMKIHVSHWFPVPAATYDRREWEIWLFERCMDVERHETMEFFKIDGVRPFSPHHRRGRNPYRVHVLGSDEDVHRISGQDTRK